MAARKDLYMHALTVVMQFYEYDSYSKNEKKAIKALTRKFSALSYRKCANAFKKILKLYTSTIPFVEENIQYYVDRYRNRVSSRQHSRRELEFIDSHKTIPRSVIMAAINWIFYWRHQR